MEEAIIDFRSILQKLLGNVRATALPCCSNLLIGTNLMKRIIFTLASGAALMLGSTVYACPNPTSGEAYSTVSERAYDLSQEDGKAFDVDIGGSAPWNSCGIQGDGFLPAKASIRLDLRAAEGRQLLVWLTKGCPNAHMFVHAGDYRGTAGGNPSTENVSVIIPRSDIGNDQTIMVYLSSDSANDVCQGEIFFRTVRE